MSRRSLLPVLLFAGLLGCAGSEAVEHDAGSPVGTGNSGGANAAAGTTGAAGTTADTGRGGATGTSGSAGSAGTTGASGTTGSAGTTGAAGTTAEAGRGGAGTTGTAGSAGTAGRGGTTGTGGAAGAGARGGTMGSAGATGMAGATGNAGRGGTTGAGGAAGMVGRGGTTGTGGAAGAAGRGGTGGGGGAAGTGGGASCSVTPVSPNATPQARNLLCYIYSLSGNHVLSGQQETSWSNPAGDISWYQTNVGKVPAILGGDYLYPSGTTSRAIAYWNAGGLTMIRYHMGAPPNSDTYENSQGTANIGNVLTNGTTENNSFKSKLDYVASELQMAKNANVAVIWAPFHEYQPNGWFWWSKGTAQQFIQLWQYMFNYLTNTKGLNNLIWLAPSSGSPNSSWYPGKAYIDLAGPDTYGTNPPFTSLYSSARNIIGTTVPIPLHETGVVPQPSTMFPTAAPWVLWNIWAGYQISDNSVANIQSAYASSYTVTRDEVPNLK